MLAADSALLVAAYSDGSSFQANFLQNAISFTSFEARLASLGQERTLIFY
jgi:hypothetical protein